MAESKAVVHASECKFCNNGAGTGRNTRGDRNGKWHGPFYSDDEAEAFAHGTGRPVRRDRCANRVSPGGHLASSANESASPEERSSDLPSPLSGDASDLTQYGFEPAGRWFLDPAAKGGVSFALNAHRRDRVLYAFIVNDRVEYIGICDARGTTLADRMTRYKNLVGAGTNARIAGLIKAAIASGAEVLIYALIPPSGPSHLGLEIDSVKGLEKPLIECFSPSWNRRR